jgi:hypothetical protein
VTDLLANGAAGVLHTTYHLGAGRKIREIGRDAERIVLANCRDASRRNLHSRTLNEGLHDGVTQGNVSVTGPFILDIPYCCETRE